MQKHYHVCWSSFGVTVFEFWSWQLIVLWFLLPFASRSLL
jgi:hypothetical protein